MADSFDYNDFRDAIQLRERERIAKFIEEFDDWVYHAHIDRHNTISTINAPESIKEIAKRIREDEL